MTDSKHSKNKAEWIAFFFAPSTVISTLLLIVACNREGEGGGRVQNSLGMQSADVVASEEPPSATVTFAEGSFLKKKSSPSGKLNEKDKCFVSVGTVLPLSNPVSRREDQHAFVTLDVTNLTSDFTSRCALTEGWVFAQHFKFAGSGLKDPSGINASIDLSLADELVQKAAANVTGTVGRCWSSVGAALASVQRYRARGYDFYRLPREDGRMQDVSADPEALLQYVASNRNHVCKILNLKVYGGPGQRLRPDDYPRGSIMLMRSHGKGDGDTQCTNHPSAGDIQVKASNPGEAALYYSDHIVRRACAFAHMVLVPVTSCD